MDRLDADRTSDELPPEIGAALRALDARATQRAARVDVERVVARVADRLRRGEGERRRISWMSPVALRVAAAVVVLAAAGVVVNLTLDHSQQTASLRLPVAMPAMDSLTAPQLEAVLEATNEVHAVTDSAARGTSGVSLDDLTEQQLQALLVSLENSEG
jgi:predicted DNA binding protein